jgi:hypothetical protein
MSNGRIAICDGLRRFANRAVMKPNRDEIEGEASHNHGRQSAWRPERRELGISTIEERSGSSRFECSGQDADRVRETP